MQITFEVTRKMIMTRNERAKKYNPNGRGHRQLLKDIECEFYEQFMISKNYWRNVAGWEVDAFHPDYGNIDVKCIDKWYNIPCKKMKYLIQQRDKVDYFYFIKWMNKGPAPLVTGEKVSFATIGVVPYWKLMDNVQVSNYNGFYADVRRLTNG